MAVKVKYIDKRHWRRLTEREYIEVKVNNKRFKGIIGLVTMNKVREPLEVTVVGKHMVVADDHYQWLQILPEKKRYSITAMFDDKGQPLEYYFDINIKNITQKGNARTLDLFLDVLVLPTGKYELVDEDDLMNALVNEQITKRQYHEAYMIAHQLMIEINDNFDELERRIMHCYRKMNQKKHKAKRHHHQAPQPQQRHKRKKRYTED